jgi:tRNA A37 methylthiotransferase MiaB
VPYTRGRERSLPVQSILNEVRKLSNEGQEREMEKERMEKNGDGNELGERFTRVKEIVLLGQNVNSYWDRGGSSILEQRADRYSIAPGFTQRSNPKKTNQSNSSSQISLIINEKEGGVRFGELLQRVAEIDPEIRIRFQSPHPKDFPDDVLSLIADTPNICNSLHIPAQHGSSSVLERMKRGYSIEAYRALVHRAREIIAGETNKGIGLGLSSDFISGFCGESESEHLENLSLMRETGFDQAFTYKYSKREQTYAGLHLKDDVPEEVKSRRLSELIDAFQLSVSIRNNLLEVYCSLNTRCRNYYYSIFRQGDYIWFWSKDLLLNRSTTRKK